MVGWHHWLNGHEFKQTPGDSEGQVRVVCCSPWGCKESDTTQQLNNNKQEKNLKKNRHMYNWITFCTSETNTTLLINYTPV